MALKVTPSIMLLLKMTIQVMLGTVICVLFYVGARLIGWSIEHLDKIFGEPPQWIKYIAIYIEILAYVGDALWYTIFVIAEVWHYFMEVKTEGVVGNE